MHLSLRVRLRRVHKAINCCLENAVLHILYNTEHNLSVGGNDTILYYKVMNDIMNDNRPC